MSRLHPDSLAYVVRVLGDREAYARGVHGCDGCCRGDVVVAGWRAP